MGRFLHEHQEPAIQDERTPVLAGKRRSLDPGRTAVVTHQDAEVPDACVRRPSLPHCGAAMMSLPSGSRAKLGP